MDIRHRERLLQVLFAAAPMLLLAGVLRTVYEAKFALPEPMPLERIAAATPGALEARFEAIGYRWPPSKPVPPLQVEQLPRGMARLPAPRKKALFFRALLPTVLAENRWIAEQRAVVKNAFDRGELKAGTRRWENVKRLAVRFRVSGDLNDPAVRRRLLRRIDTVPAALILAQAANESAWGTSRFAREANNLFGIWTYRETDGLLPLEREEEGNHFVRIFPDLRGSVREYLFNINVGHGYGELRAARAAMRAAGREPDPLLLAKRLESYSERGAAYIEEISTMIRGNGLTALARLRLDV